MGLDADWAGGLVTAGLSKLSTRESSCSCAWQAMLQQPCCLPTLPPHSAHHHPTPPHPTLQGKLTMYQQQQRRQLQAVAQFKVQRRQENMARRAAGAPLAGRRVGEFSLLWIPIGLAELSWNACAHLGHPSRSPPPMSPWPCCSSPCHPPLPLPFLPRRGAAAGGPA